MSLTVQYIYLTYIAYDKKKDNACIIDIYIYTVKVGINIMSKKNFLTTTYSYILGHKIKKYILLFVPKLLLFHNVLDKE